MIDTPSVDRLGRKLSVGDTVTFAWSDELHGGMVVYISDPDSAQIAIEASKPIGVIARDGEPVVLPDQGDVIMYSSVLRRGTDKTEG